VQVEAPTPSGVGKPVAPYSAVIVSGDLVYLSGQIPYDEDNQVVSDEFEPQARRVFDNMGRCLEAAGCGFGDVLKVNAFLVGFEDFPAFNSIYAEYFSEPYPARTTVLAGLYGALRIEVEAVARRP
jgi:2-iminobutanoate/2-iminopropanoate deaminase